MSIGQKLIDFQRLSNHKLFQKSTSVSFPDYPGQQQKLVSMRNASSQEVFNSNATYLVSVLKESFTAPEKVVEQALNSTATGRKNSELALKMNTDSDLLSNSNPSSSTQTSIIKLKTVQQYVKIEYLAAVYLAREFNEALIANQQYSQQGVQADAENIQINDNSKYFEQGVLYNQVQETLKAKYESVSNNIDEYINSKLNGAPFSFEDENQLTDLIHEIIEITKYVEDNLDINNQKEIIENKKLQSSSKNQVVVYSGTLGPLKKFWYENTKACELFIAFFFSMVLPIYITPMMTYSTPRITTLLSIAIPLSFVMGIPAGGNDVSNSMGPVFGSNTLSMPWCLFLASLFNVIGAVVLGDKVSKTISSKILEAEEFVGFDDQYALSMVAVLGSCAFACLIVTIYGIPVSITKSVIFGLATAGVCAIGWSGISSKGVIKVSVAMVTSPLVGTLIALFFNFLFIQFVIKSRTPVTRAKQALPIFGFINIFFVVFLTCLKGFKMDEGWSALAGGISGIVLAIVLMAYSSKHKIEENPIYAQGDKTREAYNDQQIGSIYKPLLIVSACAMAFTHGANDAGNTIGPLVGVLNVYHDRGVEDVEIPFWTLLLGGISFAVGISTMGKRTITTMAKKVTSLNPLKSCTIQIGGAAAILIATVLELPVSTSHCAVGAVLGATIAEKITGMPYDFQKGMFAKIAGSWFYTIPLGVCLTVYFFYGMKGAVDFEGN